MSIIDQVVVFEVMPVAALVMGFIIVVLTVSHEYISTDFSIYFTEYPKTSTERLSSEISTLNGLIFK